MLRPATFVPQAPDRGLAPDALAGTPFAHCSPASTYKLLLTLQPPKPASACTLWEFPDFWLLPNPCRKFCFSAET